jgi:nucleotide-binding universal stress UspA family protein
MRILIGYDGSEHSDAALVDLVRAGLPHNCEILIASVGDLLMSSPELSEVIEQVLPSRRVASGLKRAQNHAERVAQAAKQAAERAKKRVRTLFPEWNVRADVMIGTPAWVLIDVAEEWKADLVVVGSQGHSALKQLCVDGSPAAEQAIYAIGQRVWQNGTEVRLIAVDDGTPPVQIAARLPQAAEMINSYYRKRESRVSAMLEWATSELNAIGLKTSILTEKGDPKKVLLEEARKWNADSIFVGTRDFKNGFERFRLGSVSTAIVTNAHCSVEVVRPSEEKQE